MLTQAEDAAVTERLRNWGRAIADHPAVHTSPLYRMRVAALIAQGGRMGGADEAPPIDYDDAEMVQAAWRRLPERPERYRKAKRLLFLWYAVPGLSRRTVRNRLHISERHVDFFLGFAKELIYSALGRTDK